jgi:hypothetical protein
MATGLEMYHAVKKATERLNGAGILKINASDKRDLRKLTAEDLLSVGFDEKTAHAVAQDISNDGLDELGKAVGTKFVVEKGTLDLIPGEGIKRASETLKDDPQTFEEMLEELAWIRDPKRYTRK